MKKTFKFVLVFLLLVAICTSFLACSQNELPQIATDDGKIEQGENNQNVENTNNNGDSQNNNENQNNGEDIENDINGENKEVYNAPEFSFSRDEAEVLSEVEYQNAINEFTFKIMKELDLTQNTCISPLSIYLALAMLTNAAREDTLEQISNVLGLSAYQINEYASYLYNLYMGNTNNAKTVTIANSVWCKNGYTPYQSFIDNLLEYYNAEVYNVDFTEATVDQINNWVSTNTKGMIKKIIEELSEDCIMQLINALTFESSWSGGDKHEYDFRFNNADGTSTVVKTLSQKLYTFYSTNNADAFIYRFENSRFGFVGILPNDTIENYLEILDGAELLNLLSNPEYGYDVYTKLPTFELDYKTSLVEPLKNLGMVDAFEDWGANFRNGWNYPDANVFVKDVNHFTHIEVSKSGVRAAAVTQIGMDVATSMPPEERKEKYIYLNRPFVFVIMDTIYNVPLFIGCINNL